MSLVDLGKRLLESAKLGETEEVRQLMTNGAPFTTDWLGTSPLHMAAQHGHMATAEVLLRAGISRDARTKVDRTPLHVAAQEGHLEIVELLIKHGAEVDAKDMLRMTPLHWAVERGHMSVINCLLRNGADVNSQSKFDKTPFDIAEDNCRRDVVRILQEYASNPVKTKEDTSKNKSVQLLQTSSAATSPTVKTATPLTVKTDSISVAQIRNVVNRTVATNNRTAVTSTTSATSTSTSSANKTSSSRPILLQANLAHLQKAAAAAAVAIGGTTKSSSSDSEEGDTSEQSCTNVLATLAALAEATAPNATLSTSEALQWLETHGIAMLPADNSTVVASALEGGQTISLTEAGKLALTWVKEQHNLNNSTTEVSSSVQESVEITHLENISSSQNQKVITIVADQSQLPSIISSQQQPIVVVSSQAVNNAGIEISTEDPPVKKLKTYLGRKDQPKPTANGKVTSTEDSLEEERLKLQKELEKMRKQAEEYKAQLLQKEHEAEQYRRQLEQMRTMPRSNQ